MRTSALFLAGLLSAANAFTITSPSAGQTLDPTQPITFSWTYDSADPESFNIVLDNSASGGLTSNVQVATDVLTSGGSYILAAGSASSYGDGFVLKAETFSGTLLATSPSFSLAMGTASSSTYTGTVSSGPVSATNAAATSGMSTGGSATTDSSGSTASAATTGAQATLGGSSESSTASSAAGSTTGSNSFTTSTVSRSGSSTGTTSSSSPSATTSQNAQPKLGSRSQYAFTVAGLIAGLAALLA